jgi:hypothetical protein
VKTILTYFLSAILGGAVCAFVLHLAVKPEVVGMAASIPPMRVNGKLTVQALPSKSGQSWLESSVAKAATWLNEGRSNPTPGKLGLLLREPVVILNGGTANVSSLPSGTAVKLVHNDGRFLRVQHERNVITLPRTAVVEGISVTE